jgi:hypothetical protein
MLMSERNLLVGFMLDALFQALLFILYLYPKTLIAGYYWVQQGLLKVLDVRLIKAVPLTW